MLHPDYANDDILICDPEGEFGALVKALGREKASVAHLVAGGKDLRAFGDDNEAKDTHNVFYPGYVSDAENAALLQHCKLF